MIEYRVKRVERFIVTRHEDKDGVSQGARQIGKEFDNFETAYEVGYALARAEQERLGILPGGDGVIFPNSALDDAREWFHRPLETYRSDNPAIGG